MPWWRYVLDGTDPRLPIAARLSGSARFRESGTTRVLLLSVGEQPDQVVRAIRFVARLDHKAAKEVVERVPSRLVEHVSLASAEEIVRSLASVGADAKWELEDTWSKITPDR